MQLLCGKFFDVSSTFEPRRRGYKWMPDGKSLVYIDQRDNVSNLWRQPLDGGPPRQLTSFITEVIHQFAFAPDGRRLILSRGVSNYDVALIRNFR